MMTHALTTVGAASQVSTDIEFITRDAKEALGNMRRSAEQFIENAIRLGAAIKQAKKSLGRVRLAAWRESELSLKSSQCSVYRQPFEKRVCWVRSRIHATSSIDITCSIGIQLSMASRIRW
jgi:hypothetical protein